jgi:hypothetical protein
MTEYIQRTVCNYNTLGKYQYGALGVGAVAPYRSAAPINVNKVPVFPSVSYSTPNYNALVHGSCVDHVGINKAYITGDCVKYVDRECPGPMGLAASKQGGYTGGYTGANVM